MVPMNLLPADRTADYLLTGVWSQKAIKEARQVGKVHAAATGEATNFNRIPGADEIRYTADPAYVHVTTNNTIYGTQWRAEPPVPSGAPLIADASSDMYSRPIDVRKYGLIYAGAQKNLGPSGVVLVIIRDDLVDRGPKTLPVMLQYRTHAAEKSLYNTPPTFGIYVMGEVFKWIQSLGGLAAMAERNEAKASALYDFLDSSEFFRGTAETGSRSRMNVCFRGPTEELEEKFVKEAARRGLDGLKGHRLVGGMRASIYNACPTGAVEALISFMKEFERANRAAATRS
jgi:phosphoserine aminotransferase